MKYRNCGSENILKNGKSRSALQRFICKDCRRSWQKTYTYQSYKVENKEIVLLTREGCGIQSTGRILNISPKTDYDRQAEYLQTVDSSNDL